MVRGFALALRFVAELAVALRFVVELGRFAEAVLTLPAEAVFALRVRAYAADVEASVPLAGVALSLFVAM